MKKILILISLVVITGSCKKDKYEGTKSEWLKDAFTIIMDDPDIKAISYWNENWDDKKPVEMVINSSDEALEIYCSKVANSYFLDTLNIVNGKVLPPLGGVYHCAYPGFSEGNGTSEVVTTEKINSFVSYAGKDIGWAYFTNSWHNGIIFPNDEVEIIYNSSKTPFIRMMPWSEISPHEAQADPIYTMQKFIDGEFDTELRQWAQDLITFAKPVIIEFGPEVDGNWMPWNAEWNGAGSYSYGNPNLPDGAERFRDVYRYIIDLFRTEGVNNATWVFHVNYSPTPEEEWNKFKYYYPGDDYIDWLGVSIYGPLYKRQKWTYSFSDMWNYVKPNLQEMSNKPIAILEFGVGEL